MSKNQVQINKELKGLRMSFLITKHTDLVVEKLQQTSLTNTA